MLPARPGTWGRRGVPGGGAAGGTREAWPEPEKEEAISVEAGEEGGGQAAVFPAAPETPDLILNLWRDCEGS